MVPNILAFPIHICSFLLFLIFNRIEFDFILFIYLSFIILFLLNIKY